MIYVSAAIIRNDNNDILICQRGLGGICGFLWEFPGGKRELGETPEECLVRECKEELDIDICVDRLFMETTYAYPDRDIAFSFFNAHIISGVLKMNIHNDMQWISPKGMKSYSFCPADVTVVDKLTTLS